MIKNGFAFVGAFAIFWILMIQIHVGESIAFWDFSWRTVVCLVAAGYIGFKV